PLLLEPLPPEVREPLQPLAPPPLAPSPTEDAIANMQADVAPTDVSSSPPPTMVTVRGIPMTLNHAMERGYDWHRMGELDAAAEVYQALLAVLPTENADIWSRLGSIHYQRGDFAKAEECLARAVECFGDHPQFHNNLAIARLMLGKPDQAEASCRRALALKPDYIDALNNLGAALEAQSRFTSAAKYYKRVLEFEPYFAEGHYNLGNALRGAGRFAEAIENYHKALELRPRDAKTLHQLGTVWQALGGHGKEAEECFTLARKLEAEAA
ncbi:MAG: tetratricopeptide repeat protein, partial [Candidatus Contendobacter sp.]|nr:tetratricopeptide repeat protein [Candidatus Contendobacter sp.]